MKRMYNKNPVFYVWGGGWRNYHFMLVAPPAKIFLTVKEKYYLVKYKVFYRVFCNVLQICFQIKSVKVKSEVNITRSVFSETRCEALTHHRNHFTYSFLFYFFSSVQIL